MNKFTKSQSKKNVFFAASQILVSGLTLFVLYKYLINTLGVELIGVWSIVMAFSAFLRTGDFGFAGSIVKFVSSATVNHDEKKREMIISTSLISVSIALGVLLAIFYPIILYTLPHFIDKKFLGLAIELLPYSLVSVWLAVLSTLVVFIFDGINRVDIRSMFLVVFNIILVVLSIIFVHFFGFIGLGYAQVLQAFLQLIIAWVLVKKHISLSFILPHEWSKSIFKEIFSYSMHLQLASLMSMMLEPITKLMLGHFGSMSSVGYFDMANRLVMQVRNVIVNANQALVPMLSKAHEKDENVVSHYKLTFKVLFFVSVVVYSLVGIFTGLISKLWIGTYEIEFVYFTYLILLTLGINTLAGAAYFTNMGTGDVKFNTISQVIIAVTNLLFGLFLGYLYGGFGVVMGYGISIILGSCWLIYNFHQRKRFA